MDILELEALQKEVQASKQLDEYVSPSARALIREMQREYRDLKRSGELDGLQAAMEAQADLGRLADFFEPLSKDVIAATAGLTALKAQQLEALGSVAGFQRMADALLMEQANLDAVRLDDATVDRVSLLADAAAAGKDLAAFRSAYGSALDDLVRNSDEAARSLGPALSSIDWHRVEWSEDRAATATALVEEARSLTLLGEASLSRIDWAAIVDSGKGFDVLRSDMDAFEQSYGALLSSLAHAPAGVLSLPPSLVRLPAVEFFAHAELTSSIWAPQGAEEDVERLQVREHVDEENHDALERLLAECNPGFVGIWHGAVDALRRRGPDWLRHFSSSARELFGHALRAKAPDAEVRKWSDDPQHYWNGRPTRAARLRYIGRGIRDASFVGFMERDVTLTLEMLDYLQEGTHGIAPGFDPEKVFALRLRVEAALRFVLQASR